MIKGKSPISLRCILAVLTAISAALLATLSGSAFPQPAPAEQEATPTSTNCYQIRFEDQTFDPSLVLFPDTPFTTTWRITNLGSCVWTQDYVWVYVGGDKMGGPEEVPLDQAVLPGESVDVTVPLIAPHTEGVYIGYWMMKSPDGVLFGARQEANCAFIVAIFSSLDPEAVFPYPFEEVPRFLIDTYPNVTEVPPTPTETPTEIPETATLTSTLTPAATEPASTPTTAAQSDQPDLSAIQFTPFWSNTYIQYREPGPYVPEFTTGIPSPWDVSLEPAVIGTNFLLAALLMVPFALANELLCRMLDEFNQNRAAARKAQAQTTKLRQWFDRTLTVNSKGKLIFRDRLRVLLLILFYGLVFSLLDNTWTPFSFEGLHLFLSMTLAYGLIGMADDFLSWSKIKRWNIPARLTLSVENLLLAISSISISRILFLMPGLFFGTPELLKKDDQLISPKQQKQLLRISMFTLTAIGLAAWIPTSFTSQIILQNPGAKLILKGAEATLLIIFAVTIENYFIQMLGFPGSFGCAFKQANRFLWFLSLIVVAFLFIHTLINPRWDLLNALQHGNVVLFIGVVLTFTAGVLIAKFILWIRKRNKPDK